jgi:hypothetical protein
VPEPAEGDCLISCVTGDSVLQDAWANQVEEDGRTIGVGLKFGAGETDVHEYYRAVSEALC